MPQPGTSDAVGGQLSPAEPVTLRKLLPYAEGSIVSRTLVKNKAGTITLFSFDGGQGLSEHSAPFDAFVEVLDGEVELTIGGKAVHTLAGQTVLMPANVPHAVHAGRRAKLLLVMLRG
jgi:quercetin dioxygenase-like cupin family protein